MGCAAAIDLVAHGYHETAPVSVWWAVAILVLGLVLAVLGDLVVQFERIRVRREAQVIGFRTSAEACASSRRMSAFPRHRSRRRVRVL